MDNVANAEHGDQIKRREQRAADTATGRHRVESSRGAADGMQARGSETDDVRRNRAQKYSGQQKQRAARDQRVQSMAEINTGDPLIDRRIDKRKKKNQHARDQEQREQLSVRRFAR